MADNLTTTTTVSTIPSGSVIATDDAGAGGHVQIVKLAVSTDGSATALTADNTNGLLVNLGSNNDVTLATLPDTAAGDLAAINTAVSGTLTVGSHAVTNAGTFAVQVDGAALTALQLIDDAIYTDDVPFTAGSNAIMAAGFRFDDVAVDGVTEGDIGYARMSSNRNLYVQLRDAAGNERGLNVDASGQIAVTNADITTIAGAVSGTEMQVDVVAPLPAGTNAIGKLAANSGVDIGDVDVTSMPGTAAEAAALPSVFVVVAGDDGTDTHPLQLDASGHLQVDIAADSVGVGGGTQYTEDAPAAADPVGNALILVRQDTPATLVSLDGDNVAARATNYGAQFVQVLDSSGNFINSFGGSGGTSHTDDAIFTIGGASSITPTGYLADETTPDSVDEGDVGVPRMTLTRKPYAVITDATSENNAAVDGSGHLQVDIAADSVGIGGGTQYAVDDALGATPTGTLAVAIRDDALSALTPVEGDAIGLRVDANGALWTIPSGTVTIQEAAALDVSAATVTVDLGANNDVTINGSSVVYTESDVMTVNATDGIAVMVKRDDALSTLGQAENDAVPLRVDSTGALWIATDDTIPISWNGTAPPIGAGTEAAALRVTLATDSTGLVSVDDNGGALTVDWNGTAPPIGAGLEATALRVTVATDSTGVLSIDDNAGSLTVDNAGTFAVQVDGDALTALQLIDNSIYVDDADWTADTSSHTLVGAVTQATPSANTDGDTTPLITNALRELRTAALESDLAAAGTAHVHKYFTSATPTDGIIWSPAAGKRWYVTHLSINVSAASTVTIEDDLVGGDDPVYKAEFAANSGVVLTFPDVPLFSGEDAADLTVTASAGTVYVTAVGYEI